MTTKPDLAGKKETRAMQGVNLRMLDEEQRTAELSFSSDAPVERFFGHEVLDHGPQSIRFNRLNNRATAAD